MLGGVDVEDVLKYVLSFLVADDSVIDGVFWGDQSNCTGRHDSEATLVSITLHWSDSAENLDWISNKVLL